MSELKSFIVLYDGKFISAYEESEADKVIADLEESHKKEVEQLLMTILELKEKLAAPQLVQRLNEPEALYSNLDTMGRLKHETDVVARRERHHKYKRCLANAEACMHKRWRTDEGFDYARSHRHMNKWMEIAEKFKEAK